MSPKKKTTKERGNYISEWFAHRVYPVVTSSDAALQDQKTHRCPMLSHATGEHKECIKTAASKGVCTVNSGSNGPRQDWLVCPYRALDDGMLEDAARRLFRCQSDTEVRLVPAPLMASDRHRATFCDFVRRGGLGLLYMQNRLGGEISLRATPRSPELAFDSTLIEVIQRDDGFHLGRYGFLEIQTMDFHGSYRNAVKNITDALRLHEKKFPNEVERNSHWLSEKVEGPNIANVFKRTFYQMMLKFQIGAQPPCVGCVFAVPRSVWDSWQRHLGAPDLVEKHLEPGVSLLLAPNEQLHVEDAPAWIYVFDLDVDSPVTPNPIRVEDRIATSASALAYYALEVAPAAAISAGGDSDRILERISTRMADWWPEVISPAAST